MIPFEACVESPAAARAAVTAGATRLELCADLAAGGVTPEADTLSATLRAVQVPVHVMLRPRSSGDFVHDDAELAQMLRDLAWIRASGARGIVFGLATPWRTVDVARTAALVGAARPLAVTFHRAFDVARDLAAALEILVALGIERVLTSGGAADALAGAGTLRALVEQARGRILVMAGGGVRAENHAEILRRAQVPELHGSVPFRPGG